MWIYRLGLTRVKQLALTGDSITGKEVAEMGLINKSVPAEKLEEETLYWANRMANCPSTQLAAMKLVVNQAFDNMGLQTTQHMGVIMDGAMRNTPEGKAFVQRAMEGGVGAAVEERDRPFGDYTCLPTSEKPHGMP